MLLAYREEFPNAIDRIVPGAPDLWAQVYHAIREEWAVTADDVIHRRTTLGLRGFDSPEIRQMISAFLAPGVDDLQGCEDLRPKLSSRRPDGYGPLSVGRRA